MAAGSRGVSLRSEATPGAFVVDAIAEERKLSTGQRAMAVALGLVDTGGRRNGRFSRNSIPAGPPG